MGQDNTGLLLALAAENAELRQQLAAAQDLLVETTIDAGQLHARIEALQTELVEVRGQRDAWRAETVRLKEPAPRTA